MQTSYDAVKLALKEKPKTWLVTGVAGFIGSNLLEELLGLGQTVIGLDNFSTGFQKNLDDVREAVGADLWANFEFLEGDICNFETCLKASQNVDVILHQAALGSVPRSIENPIASNLNNVDGTLNMFLAAHQNKIQRLVYASSSSVYGDHPDLPKQEEKVGSPLSPYAITKCVNELYANVMAQTHDLKLIGLRYFNVFGKRQNPNGAYAAVIPKWLGGLLNDETIYINGTGETSRDFCYIANTVQANILAATTENPDAINQVYNVAVHARTDLNQLFNHLRTHLGEKESRIQGVEPVYRDFRKGDVMHSEADITKAKTRLGYAPTHDISAGLKETIDWYYNKQDWLKS